ncbi:MAG: hypothetical protein Q9160_008607 [Pyrenula sp. 1 TL-2023]
MHGWGLFFFLLFLLAIIGAIGWVAWTQYRARQSGLPPPSWKSYIPFLKSENGRNYPTPRASGPIDWIKDKIAGMRNKRTAEGAYESNLEGGTAYAGSTGGRRGRGLEQDEAWDARVGNEADGYGPGGYHEEQELGLSTPRDPYGGSGYTGAPTAVYGEGQRGRSRSREPEAHHGIEQRHELGHGHARAEDNPFGDQYEASNLRDVSPRPVLDTAQAASAGHTKGKGSHDDSPTERRSMFRESL